MVLKLQGALEPHGGLVGTLNPGPYFQRICLSNKFPGTAAGLGTQL